MTQILGNSHPRIVIRSLFRPTGPDSLFTVHFSWHEEWYRFVCQSLIGGRMPNAWLLDEIYGVGVSSYGSGVGWADLSLITSQIMWYIHRLKCARYLRNSVSLHPTIILHRRKTLPPFRILPSRKMVTIQTVQVRANRINCVDGRVCINSTGRSSVLSRQTDKQHNLLYRV